ncbi:MAG: multidrug ABC transporter ATP-binding protein [Gammaproteobacteria bacterium RIFCSPHIGHO2_12_FULL_43_28]|nr:MAG: multidrug ABC transporter ATP-binding protein [Gammaproteobacteria bacterium RIFCSPHIGHO2_12_FULL_43_28]
MRDENVIDVHHLSKAFNGKPAVVNVSLDVKAGEIFGFLGPNGSGKTTTIRMLCGLMTPDEGDGYCLGFDILHETAKIKRHVGYVPQSFSLYKDLTVKENLEFMAQLYQIKNFKNRVDLMMAELELDRYKDILAGRLSGGWKQKLSLAAALIHDPKLLLLDEPTAGVDPKTRREFWNYILSLTTRGVTALVSTHYMDEAERCNRLAYIVYGRLMAEGTVRDIIAQQKMFTFVTRGDGLPDLYTKLTGRPGVEQVVVWGNELRVCAIDRALLQTTLADFPDYTWEETRTSLEEVFIHLVNEEKRRELHERRDQYA